jgi:hypothetical protein
MIGRIFTGRQSKGHMAAVETVKRLYCRSSLFELHIIGHVQPGLDDCAANLTQLAAGLPITFHYSVTRDEERAVLTQSHFVYNIGAENEDPANSGYEVDSIDALVRQTIQAMQLSPAEYTPKKESYLLDDRQEYFA